MSYVETDQRRLDYGVGSLAKGVSGNKARAGLLDFIVGLVYLFLGACALVICRVGKPNIFIFLVQVELVLD